MSWARSAVRRTSCVVTLRIFSTSPPSRLRQAPHLLNRSLSAYTPAAGGKASPGNGDEVASGGKVDGATSPQPAKGTSGNVTPSASGADEPWAFGRMMDRFDERLAARREAIRQRELGVIDRFTSLIATLDGALDVREGDEFIAWLDAQLVSGASPSGAEGGGSDTGGAEDHAEERARLERFLADAAARLNALVVDKRETVFRDRGGGTVSAAKASEAAEAQQSLPPELPEEELYEVRLTAHRALLGNCLAFVSSSLERQHLKPGLTVEDVAAVTRSAYLAGPDERLRSMFVLFDAHGDGFLDEVGVERAVDAVVNPITKAAELCYAGAARGALDTRAAAAMPATMRYILWDVIEVPMKRRCSFTWAKERKQVGPDEWRVSWEQFAPSRRENFPEFDKMTTSYMEQYRKRRSDWHEGRKARRRAVVYGTSLFIAVVMADSILAVI